LLGSVWVFDASLRQRSESTNIQRDQTLYPVERPHPLTNFETPLLNAVFLSQILRQLVADLNT
jgi:hypothetical protein